jgi:hypothetical protein
MERLRKRVSILETRNQELNRELGAGGSRRRLRGARPRVYPKGQVDRLIWLLLEIESVCPRPGVRGQIRVSHSDAKLLRKLVDAIVNPK